MTPDASGAASRGGAVQFSGSSSKFMAQSFRYRTGPH